MSSNSIVSLGQGSPEHQEHMRKLSMLLDASYVRSLTDSEYLELRILFNKTVIGVPQSKGKFRVSVATYHECKKVLQQG